MWPTIFSSECGSGEGPCGTRTYLQALDNGWWKSGSIMATNLLLWGLLASCPGRPCRAWSLLSASTRWCLLTNPGPRCHGICPHIQCSADAPGAPQWKGTSRGQYPACLHGSWIHPLQTQSASFHSLHQDVCTFVNVSKGWLKRQNLNEITNHTFTYCFIPQHSVTGQCLDLRVWIRYVLWSW